MEFEVLLTAVETATKRFLDARDEASRAKTDETAALNALNYAQRKLDVKIIQLKKEAPHQSEWFRLRENAAGLRVAS